MRLPNLVTGFILLATSGTVFGQEAHRSKSIQDVKSVFSQCSGRAAFTAGLIRNGSITFPQNVTQDALLAYLKETADYLALADRLPGPPANAAAEKFYELLVRQYRESRDVERTMKDTFAAHQRCADYTTKSEV